MFCTSAMQIINLNVVLESTDTETKLPRKCIIASKELHVSDLSVLPSENKPVDLALELDFLSI